MAISEAARSDLYTGLRDIIGPDRAETLMSAIPLHELDKVATKADLVEFRAELKGEMAELKGDIAEFRADLAREIGALRKTMTNWMLTILVAVIGAMASVGFLG